MRLAPSILSADFSRLASEIERVERAGAHQLHVDVMDGHYVPNLTFGPMVVEAIRRVTRLPLDVHLMIEDADRWINAFVDAGSDMIAFHPESVYHPHLVLTSIQKQGKKAGLALNPGLSLASVEELLPLADYAIVMSVNPGWGGQDFIEGSFERAESLRRFAQENDLTLDIEIDGGMNAERVPRAALAGIDVVIAGSAIFKAKDPEAVIRQMLSAVPV
ncbi:MAG TPA: ribulose-phosphate 3-epimerase [Vicinamibacteria bacterium]|nr:ribulose-phosphate 3-epimerase [Vicinamibacteria bacterium]